ncbi:MAG: NADH-quinone oxidoreductase subunit J, partial [Acidimicrobiia bacterium]
MVEVFVFVVAAVVCVAGAIGVVASRHPVHAALSLVATLFGIAVLFVAQEANFLAAVQVIVYAGAIVVLFLFVIMLLGVDQVEDLQVEPIRGQRVAAAVVGLVVLALPILAVASSGGEATGVRPGPSDRNARDAAV